MQCINTSSPFWIDLVKAQGENRAFYLWDKYDSEVPDSYYNNPIITPKIVNNISELNLSDEEIDDIYENYVNLMDRKREGKSLSKEKFSETVLPNLQVFKDNNTFIFGEWDIDNNVFRARLMSSPTIKTLFNSLNVLKDTVDVVAAVPRDIGGMLERLNFYKLDVVKFFDFRGEMMVKNLYFSNPDSIRKIFKKDERDINEEDIEEYDKYYNPELTQYKLAKNFVNYSFKNEQRLNPKKDISIGLLKRILPLLKKDKIQYDDRTFMELELEAFFNFAKEHRQYLSRLPIGRKIMATLQKYKEDYKLNADPSLIKEMEDIIGGTPLSINIKPETITLPQETFYEQLTKLGIYDYNAFKLAKKIKENRFSEEDKQDLIKDIIRNSAINKVNIDKTDLFNNPKIYNELDNELNKTLATFLSKFGIKTELLEDIQDTFGIDSFAHVDILNKIIYAQENNQQDYPQQAGKLIAFMMQHNPLVTEITTSMKRFSMFKGLTQDQLTEAVGDLISQELHNKTNTELPVSLIESIKNLIRQFFDLINSSRMSRINRAVGYIADNILLQNQSLITASTYKPGATGKPVIRISLEEALKSDKFGNDIVERMAKYFILTGSITLAEQGIVLRPDENQMHDIDWVSSLSRADTMRLFEQLYPNNEYIRNIKGDDYDTDTWLIAPDGYTIKNLHIDRSKKVFKNGVETGSTNKIMGYDIVDSEGNIVSSYIPEKDSHTGEVAAKTIDIFSYETDREAKTSHRKMILRSGTVLRIADWRNTMGAKLNYGRLKDIWDYNRYVPKENPQIFQQTDEMASPVASKETIEKFKGVMKSVGIDIVELQDYLKGNPAVKVGKNTQGLADIVNKIVAIANGREDVALIEEYVHIATAMIEQHNPALITSLISKIEKFGIYKQVLEVYKDKKAYQLPSGKPDIRKIKKEAVDKLLVEIIIVNEQGGTIDPALLEQKEEVKSWWQAILATLRSIFRNSNFGSFEDVAERIAKGEVNAKSYSPIIDPGTLNGIYLSVDPNEDTSGKDNVQNDAVDNIYNTYVSYDKRLEIPPFIEGKEDRYYLFDGITRVLRSVTEKLRASSKMKTRTEEETKVDEFKKRWGIEGHKYLEDYIRTNLLDAAGYALKKFRDVGIKSELGLKQKQVIEAFAEDLISSYPDGTRFLVETMVINTKEKGLLASTIDFIAIEPHTKKDGTKTAFVDILDWKFTDINKSRSEDIPWYKQEDWQKQMGEYKIMTRQYGVKADQIRNTRMVPFIMNYQYRIRNKAESGLVPTTIEVGAVDPREETKLYLLPVALDTEMTTNPEVNALISKLRGYHSLIFKKPRKEGESHTIKSEELNEISMAIRALQVQLNFTPLVSIGKTFVQKTETLLENLKEIDIDSLDEKELNNKLGELLAALDNASYFMNANDVFTTEYGTEYLDEEAEQTLEDLNDISVDAKSLMKSVRALQREYVLALAKKQKLVSDVNEETFFDAEREISTFAYLRLEASKLPAKLIKLSSIFIQGAAKLVNIRFNQQMQTFNTLYADLLREASSQGKTPFEMVATVEGDSISFIKKIKPEFFKKLNEVRQSGDRKEAIAFILPNVDEAKYDALIASKIEQKAKNLVDKHYSNNQAKDAEMKKIYLKIYADSIDIRRPNFNGFKTKDFGYIINNSLKEDVNLTEDYINLKKNPAAFKMWEFFTGLNAKAESMGYLDKQGKSHYPLIEAAVLDKFSQADSLGREALQQLKDSFLVKEGEFKSFGGFNEATGEVIDAIPTPFKTTQLPVERLSRDLKQVASLWLYALNNYEVKSSMDNVLKTLESIEDTKGSIITDQKGDIVWRGDRPAVNEGVSKNAQYLKTINNDFLYGLEDALDSIGNLKLTQGVKKVADAFGATEDQKETVSLSTKKVIKGSNTWFRNLALGVKPLLTIANTSGNIFHAVIYKGGMYSGDDYRKSATRVFNMSVEEKALLYLMTPLNENIRELQHRISAKGESLSSYLQTFSLTDIVMSTNSYPEIRLQMVNALSFFKNTIIIDGKLVNARQYLKEQDRKEGKYKPGGNVRQVEKTFEARLAALVKKYPAVIDRVKIEENKVSLTGVSDEEMANYSLRITDFGRKLNGQMSNEDKAGYKRDTVFNSFMTFKHWIPKMTYERTQDLNRNHTSGELEYGRMRVFAKTMLTAMTKRSIGHITSIINGSPEGLAFLRDVLEQKKQEHYEKTGEILDISEEEFFDAYRTELSRAFRELGILLSLFAILLTAKVFAPDDDEDLAKRNRYKYLLRGLNKITDEVAFYYNPFSMEAITRGTILPSLQLLTKVSTFLVEIEEETRGNITDDEKLIKESHPLKYGLNLFPVANPAINDILPLTFPDLAKEMGVRVTEQARRQ